MKDPIWMKRELAQQKIDAAKALVEGKEKISVDDERKVDALIEESKALRAAADKLQRIEDIEGNLSPELRPGDPDPYAVASVTTRRGERKLRGFKSERDAYAAGMWIHAVLAGNEHAARWTRDNMRLPMGAGGENVGTKGGFLVPEELSRAIIANVEEYGDARRYMGTITMGSDTMTVPKRTGGLTVYTVAENTEVTTSDKAWDQVSLVARKIGALHRVSAELVDDAVIDVAADVATEFGLAFAEHEDNCAFIGDGTGTYSSITGINYRFENEVLAGETTAAGADFENATTANLAATIGLCPAYALRNAAWYTSVDGFANMFQRLADGAGGASAITLSQGLGLTPTWSGFPIRIVQKIGAGGSGNVLALFGDLSRAALMGLRSDLRVLTSNERYMEYDQIGILGIERFDVKVHSLGDGSTAGPVVALLGA